MSYHVALSFANAQRPTARDIYNSLTAKGYVVFYDEQSEEKM